VPGLRAQSAAGAGGWAGGDVGLADAAGGVG
jgi:hypothetical protein